jgi:hypothetical protein
VVTFLYFYTGIIENGVQLTARDIKKHEMGSSFDKLLSQFKSRLEFPDTGYEYCKFGGNLEYLSFHCVSDKFDKLKNAISDIDKPPVVKMVAMVASSIAVGCNETSLFISHLLVENHNDHSYDRQHCNAVVIHGPKENDLFPCDVKSTEITKKMFKGRNKFEFMYHILSSSLFLTLGCHDLAKHSLKYLFQDIKNTKKRDLNGSSYHYNKDVLIMNYVYEHKFDQQRIVEVKDLIAKTEETESNNSTLKKVTKHKRSLNKGDIDLYFFVKFRCGIVRPLGIMLNSISNLTCLQLCLNDESCKSAGYTNDNSQQCHLNTEIENEVGAFFSCGQGESRRWNYCEKRKDIKYFLISCKLYGAFCRHHQTLQYRCYHIMKTTVSFGFAK